MKTEIKKITIEELDKETSKLYLYFLNELKLTEEQAALISAVYGESPEDRLAQEITTCKDYDRPYDKGTLETILRTEKFSAIIGLFKFWGRTCYSAEVRQLLSWRYLCKDFVEEYKKGLYDYALIKVSNSLFDGYYVVLNYNTYDSYRKRHEHDEYEDDDVTYKGITLLRVNYEYWRRNIRAIEIEKWKEYYDEIVALL